MPVLAYYKPAHVPKYEVCIGVISDLQCESRCDYIVSVGKAFTHTSMYLYK